ncbi:MAG TPA: prepilin-type N-terminal cleavage/methylation domain-containing protein [Candidatus Hydrogenedentes bacterium]|nr:prepilin-type N-terminal cleavage/methylation domain-containing protein [Candidatus Hydrogenedentota bacterium]HNT88972.1 prepilin-type N-terminal cleavage/methylation domain-containing protein [Candidatus Hydrogenedentota bacterium]
MMRARGKNNAGYTLLEMLAVFAVMMMALNLAGTVVTKSTRLSAATTRALDGTAQLGELERAFVDAVRTSCGATDGIGIYRTGPETLVLCMPPTADGDRYVVFHFLPEQQRLMRLRFESRGGEAALTAAKTFLLPVAAATMSSTSGGASGGEDALFALDLEVSSPSGRVRTTHRVLAAPRGVAP